MPPAPVVCPTRARWPPRRQSLLVEACEQSPPEPRLAHLRRAWLPVYCCSCRCPTRSSPGERAWLKRWLHAIFRLWAPVFPFGSTFPPAPGASSSLSPSAYERSGPEQGRGGRQPAYWLMHPVRRAGGGTFPRVCFPLGHRGRPSRCGAVVKMWQRQLWRWPDRLHGQKNRTRWRTSSIRGSSSLTNYRPEIDLFRRAGPGDVSAPSIRRSPETFSTSSMPFPTNREDCRRSRRAPAHVVSPQLVTARSNFSPASPCERHLRELTLGSCITSSGGYHGGRNQAQ